MEKVSPYFRAKKGHYLVGGTDNGADLSAIFTDDINGQERGEEWSIGADEYGVAAKRKKDDGLNENNLPKVFALHQNMPNPFNPLTSIKYEIPFRQGSSNVYQTLLQIYDVRGRVVRTLLNEEKRPGYYSVAWDGKANNGKVLASGLYVYKFRSGNFIKQKKMILMK